MAKACFKRLYAHDCLLEFHKLGRESFLKSGRGARPGLQRTPLFSPSLTPTLMLPKLPIACKTAGAISAISSLRREDQSFVCWLGPRERHRRYCYVRMRFSRNVEKLLANAHVDAKIERVSWRYSRFHTHLRLPYRMSSAQVFVIVALYSNALPV